MTTLARGLLVLSALTLAACGGPELNCQQILCYYLTRITVGFSSSPQTAGTYGFTSNAGNFSFVVDQTGKPTNFLGCYGYGGDNRGAFCDLRSTGVPPTPVQLTVTRGGTRLLQASYPSIITPQYLDGAICGVTCTEGAFALTLPQ